MKQKYLNNRYMIQANNMRTIPVCRYFILIPGTSQYEFQLYLLRFFSEVVEPQLVVTGCCPDPNYAHTPCFLLIMHFIHTSSSANLVVPWCRNHKGTNIKLIIQNNGLRTSPEIAIKWIPHILNKKLALVYVMAWRRREIIYCLRQCWFRFISPYGVTRSQWVNTMWPRRQWLACLYSHIHLIWWHTTRLQPTHGSCNGIVNHQWPLLLTWINFDPNKDM